MSFEKLAVLKRYYSSESVPVFCRLRQIEKVALRISAGLRALFSPPSEVPKRALFPKVAPVLRFRDGG